MNTEELQVLAAQAGAVDADVAAANAPPVDAAAPGAPAVDPLAEARDVIGFGVELFKPLYPSIAGVYTPDACDQLAAVTAPLMQKYGLTLSGLFERWGEEFRFALVAVPMAAATVAAIRADNATRKTADGAADQPTQSGAD